MQISKPFLIAFIIGAAAWPAYSQPASPELQTRALELLRQTISQQRQQTARPSTNVGSSQPASSAQQDQAIQLLRGATAPQLAAPPSSTAVVPPKAQTPTGKTQPAPKTGAAPRMNGKKAPSAQVEPAPAPALPEQPAGPKTKQQKLADLLELYKADKLTPPEYQSQRAKILAEP